LHPGGPPFSPLSSPKCILSLRIRPAPQSVQSVPRSFVFSSILGSPMRFFPVRACETFSLYLFFIFYFWLTTDVTFPGQSTAPRCRASLTFPSFVFVRESFLNSRLSFFLLIRFLDHGSCTTPARTTIRLIGIPPPSR